MTNTTARIAEVTFSVLCGDGTFSTLDVQTVASDHPQLTAVAAHRALGTYLRDNRMPSATYGFAWDDKFRKDVWSREDDDFLGCNCDGAAGDPECDIFACWGRAPGR